MKRLRTVITVIVLLAATGPRPAEALNYKEIARTPDGKRVLLAYNCGFLANDPDCPLKPDPVLSRFALGELSRLQNALNRGPFAEVWLLSGGGVLTAGIEFAVELRRRSMTVRVPNGARLRSVGLVPASTPHGEPLTVCVSSCTVAFMGGRFRFVDIEPGDEATYEVHAGSRVSWGNLDDPDVQRAIQQTTSDARTNLPGLLDQIAAGNHLTARRLFTLFQDTLWLTVKARIDVDDAELRARRHALDQLDATFPGYGYPPAEYQRDRALLEIEGDGALQDIVMRAERDSMAQALSRLERVMPSLGRRADAALAMVRAMYGTSAILETNRMPKETLIRMGYITEFIK